MAKLIADDLTNFFVAFCVAFGVMLGGCLIGGLGAFLLGQPPMEHIKILAGKLKIWALVAAIGGTFDTITAIERGFLGGSPLDIVKQLLFIFSAFLGAHSGMKMLHWFVGGEL